MKRGDIVFNHIQSREILENGYTNSRAKLIGESAHAHGTAYAGYSGSFNTKKTSSSKKKKTTSSSKSGSSGKSGKSNSGSSSKKLSKLKTYVEGLGKVFDFIEVKIQRLTELTDLWTSKAENVSSLNSAMTNYGKAISSTGKAIKTNASAANRYEKYAKKIEKESKRRAPKTKNSSAKKNKSRLKTYFKRVREGSLNINTISNDSMRSAVEEYQKWYDKAKAAKQQVEELKKQQQELAQSKLDKVLSYYDALISKQEALLKGRQAWEDFSAANGSDTLSYQEYSKNQEKKILSSTLSRQQDKYNKYNKEFNSVKDYLTTEQKAEAEAQLEELKTAITETKTSIAQLGIDIDNIRLEKFTRLTDAAEKAANNLEKVAEKSEAFGNYTTKSDKEQQINKNNGIISGKQKEIAELQSQLLHYKAGSTEFNSRKDKIESLYSEIQDYEIKNEQLRQEAIMIPLEESDRKINERSIRVNENNTIMSMLNQDNLLDPDTGKLTTDGQAKIALLSDNIRQEQLNQNDLAEQKKALQTLYDTGQLGAKTFSEKMAELNEKILEGASSINSYKQEIVDLGKENMQAEVDALVKIIDKRREALSRKKEYYDYDKNLKNQTKDLQALEAQRAALEGIEGEAAKAQRAKLDAQIAEAQESLQDTKTEHQYNLEVQGYDDLSEKLQESLDKQLEKLSGSLEEQSKLINKFLTDIGNSYSDVFSKITDTVINSGMSQGMSNLYNSEYNSSANGKTPAQNASNIQNQNSNITNNVANPSTDINGNTGTSGNKVNSNPVNVGTPVQKPTIQETNRPLSSFNLTWGGGNLYYYSSHSVGIKDILPPDAVNQTFTWSTSNKSVVTISGTSGKSITVRGIRVGSATITCRSANGVSRSINIKVTYSKGQQYAASHGLSPLNGGKLNKKLSEYSSLNQYLLGKGFKALSNPKGVESVGRKLGLITSKNSKKGKEFYKGKDGKYSSAQYNKIKDKLHKAGLRDGGVINDLVPVSRINGIIATNHDHGIATVRRDEILLKPESAEIMKEALTIAKSVADVNLKNNLSPLSTESGSTYYDALIKVESGGMIDKSVLNELKAVAKEIYNEEQGQRLKEFHKVGRKRTFGQ